MLTASALNSSEYRRRVFLVMNTSNASSMRLTGVSAPIRPVQFAGRSPAPTSSLKRWQRRHSLGSARLPPSTIRHACFPLPVPIDPQAGQEGLVLELLVAAAGAGALLGGRERR